MSQAIEGGIVSNFLGLLDSIFKSVFQDLEDAGFKNSEYEEIKDDKGNMTGFSFTCVSEQNNTLHVKALKSSGRSNLYDFYIVGDNNSKKKYLGKSKEELDDCIVDFLERYYEEPDSVDLEYAEETEDSENIDVDTGEFESANSSKKLQISLSKIQSSGEIKYDAIFCNYNELEAYEDLENILDTSEFSDTLSEKSQNFEIIPNEDHYDVKIIDKIQPMDYISAVIKFQFITLLQLYACKFNGDILLDRNPLNYVQTIRWQLDFMIDCRLTAYDIDIKSILQSITPEDMEPQGDVSSIVENYATVLDMYYPNFPHEVQHLLDEWLLTLRYNH